jgi:hypothetical protein
MKIETLIDDPQANAIATIIERSLSRHGVDPAYMEGTIVDAGDILASIFPDPRPEAGTAGVVRVKALEWRESAITEHKDLRVPYSRLVVTFAESAVGTYGVAKGSQGRFEVWLGTKPITGSYSSIDAAKAAAQTDYEARINAALAASPAATREIASLSPEERERRMMSAVAARKANNPAPLPMWSPAPESARGEAVDRVVQEMMVLQGSGLDLRAQAQRLINAAHPASAPAPAEGEAVEAVPVADTWPVDELDQRIMGALDDFRSLAPEEGEDWEVWYAAAFDMASEKISGLIHSARIRSAAARSEPATEIVALLDAARELDRWSLVIESAMHHDAPKDHPKVMAAIRQLRAAAGDTTRCEHSDGAAHTVLLWVARNSTDSEAVRRARAALTASPKPGTQEAGDV